MEYEEQISEDAIVEEAETEDESFDLDDQDGDDAETEDEEELVDSGYFASDIYERMYPNGENE
jgi:hypothetical protein